MGQRISGGDNNPLHSYLEYNPITDRVEATREVISLLSSFQLADQWKISSGGADIDFLNLQKEISFQPLSTGWRDQSVLSNQDRTGWIKATSNIPGDLIIVDLYGPAHATATSSYHSNFTGPFDATFFGIEFIVEEEILSTDHLFYTVNYGSDHTSPEIFAQRWSGTNYSQGSTVALWYETPFRVVTGQDYHISLFKASTRDGARTLLQVRSRASDSSLIYVNVRYRSLETADVKLDHVHLLDGSTDQEHIVTSDYLVDASTTTQTIDVYKGVRCSFLVRDTEKKFNTNNVTVNFYAANNTTIEHTATLNKKDKTTIFYHEDGAWYYSEEGKGKTVEIASSHTSSDDFGEEVVIIGEVQNYSALPSASLSNGETWEALETQGTWLLGTKKKAGLWNSNGSSWSFMGVVIGQVSAAEITAGTETLIRRFSPSNIKSIVDEHATVTTPNEYAVTTFSGTPSTASSSGTTGEIRYSTSHIYVCTATNTWKRILLSTW